MDFRLHLACDDIFIGRNSHIGRLDFHSAGIEPSARGSSLLMHLGDGDCLTGYYKNSQLSANTFSISLRL